MKPFSLQTFYFSVTNQFLIKDLLKPSRKSERTHRRGKKVKNIKMGKAVAEKFAGKWKQESTDNIDALNTKLGFGWATRKIANMMDVHIEITCNADSMHFSTKTKLKSMESTLPYTGSSDQKGFSDEVIATTVVYEGDDMVINGKGVKCGDKLEDSRRVFSLKNGKLHIIQTVGGITGTRILVKQ
ncbi:unnamed protein product [Oikopleura dioica]|uniref:Lipocalin/cytosolic fatty-acid binding domain-containing protein n=1 Tax=Oikopleura dioica TaxID=34765 RepID=E4Y5J5_OIKDI|nr:unnamed protein product [Oikopleura dioica]